MSRLGVPDERPEVDGPRGEEEGEDVGGGERAEDDECVGEVERRDHDHQPERVEREEGPEVEARRPVPPPEQVHALHRLAAHLEPRHARRPQIGAGELRGGRRRGGEGELRSGFDANLRGGGGCTCSCRCWDLGGVLPARLGSAESDRPRLPDGGRGATGRLLFSSSAAAASLLVRPLLPRRPLFTFRYGAERDGHEI